MEFWLQITALLVMPRLDYSNAALAGLPASQLHGLQLVLNAAARLTHRSSRYEHITPMPRDLHWLRSVERIEDYKLAVLVYRCLHGLDSGATVSLRLHPARRQVQSPPLVSLSSRCHPCS